MFEYLLIFLTFVLLVVSAKKVGFLPFPTALILFLGISQVMSVLLREDIVSYGMHELYDFGGLEQNFLIVQAIYTSIALVAVLALTGKFKSAGSVDLSGTLRALISTGGNARFIWISVAVALCCMHCMLYLLVSDWSQLWLYTKYLSIDMDPKWVAIFGTRVSDTIIKSGPAFAILSCLSVCSLFGTRHTILKFFAAALTVFYYLTLLSQHSRAAAFFPLLIAINFGLLRLKWRTVVIPLLIAMTVISFLGALIGRGTDRHGFSALPETIASPFVTEEPLYIVTQAIMDSCQGIVVTAESLQIPADFDRRYEILAFSPLPSYVDGYGSIREDSEHRLHDYVPMSGVGEIYHFGWLYVVVLLVGYVTLIRAHTRTIARNAAIFILCNLLITMSVYVLLAYPLRNALRFFWLAAVMVAVADIASRRSAKAKRPQRGQRLAPRGRMPHSTELNSYKG
jgi:hypothetical protein